MRMSGVLAFIPPPPPPIWAMAEPLARTAEQENPNSAEWTKPRASVTGVRFMRSPSRELLRTEQVELRMQQCLNPKWLAYKAHVINRNMGD